MLPLVKNVIKRDANDRWGDPDLRVCVDFGDNHGKVYDTKEGKFVRECTPEELELALKKRAWEPYLVYVMPVDIGMVKSMDEWQELTPMAKAIVRDHLAGMKKVIGSPTVYLNLHGGDYQDKNGNRIEMTMDDVQMAYDICFGDGCEYEWPYG